MTGDGVRWWLPVLVILAQAPAAAQPTVAAGVFHQCGLQGSAKPAKVRGLNLLKNRATEPPIINTAITAAALMAPGDDTARFSMDDGAAIRVFVTNAKPGGIESVNCGAKLAQWRDTHIEVNATGPGYKGLPLIIEVSPRWRAAMSAVGEDWSTAALKTALVGHWVEVTGWIFVDGEHAQNAKNTNPHGTSLWRQTIVELHPVTAIRVLP